MLQGHWIESGQQKIELHFDDTNVTVSGLELVFQRLYGNLDYSINAENGTSALSSGAFFQDHLLCQECVEFIRKDLTPDTVLHYLDFAEKTYYGTYSEQVIESVVLYLLQNGHENQDIRKKVFPNIGVQWLERIIGSDYFFVHSEFERYKLLKEVVLERSKEASIYSTPTPPDIENGTSADGTADEESTLHSKSEDSSQTPKNSKETPAIQQELVEDELVGALKNFYCSFAHTCRRLNFNRARWSGSQRSPWCI
jgi:hypothetical protein